MDAGSFCGLIAGVLFLKAGWSGSSMMPIMTLRAPFVISRSVSTSEVTLTCMSTTIYTVAGRLSRSVLRLRLPSLRCLLGLS